MIKPSTNTVASIGIGLPVVMILAWVADSCCHWTIPAEVQNAAAVVITTFVGWVAEIVSNWRARNAQ